MLGERAFEHGGAGLSEMADWLLSFAAGAAGDVGVAIETPRGPVVESLKRMLTGAVQRLGGGAGDPVVQLQTNFGGGKTHSMLALYHLFSGAAPGDLAGVDTVLRDAGAGEVPSVRRVVLVGNKISPGNPVTKPDGTVVRTLWGELAWQLGGQEAFARVAADDARATNPGDALRALFNEHAPV